MKEMEKNSVSFEKWKGRETEKQKHCCENLISYCSSDNFIAIQNVRQCTKLGRVQ